jgi:4-amino-4-deoxy-L-arabinose transferase-like glycosyltransferase
VSFGGWWQGRTAALSLAAVSAVLISFHLNEPGWFDNEGRFAEGAREMMLRGDFVTPYVNFIPLLTKPPLTHWLVALVYWVAGPTEWARLVSIAAAMWTVVATCRLGARLFGEKVGFVAGVCLVTTLGFVLEARTLRPDSLVIASVTTAILCWYEAEHGEPDRRRAWLLAMYATLGVGTLAKGLVPPFLVGIVVTPMALRRSGLAGIRRLVSGAGLAVYTALVLPWHVAAAVANPGFGHDYLFNQHVAAALDVKVPRDSGGDTLLFYLQAFLGRASPWILFLPLTFPEAVRRLRGRAPEIAEGTLLLWSWVAGVVGVFCLSPARLEHYSLPALPAVALLGARAWHLLVTDGLRPLVRVYFALVAVILVVAGGLGIAYGPSLVTSHLDWVPGSPRLVALIMPAAAIVTTTGVLMLIAVWWRTATGVVGALAAGTVPALAVLVRALVSAEALFSWHPVARALSELPPDTEIVFEAPVEYQNIGALNFYMGRPVTMLEPAGGYVRPGYLRDWHHEMFITRDELERRWQSGRPIVLLSNPQSSRDTAAGLVSAPYHVLDRFGDRWVLTNFTAIVER